MSFDNGNNNSETFQTRDMSKKGFDIEKLSFQMIESEIGNHGYNELEWPIVRRVIHATADFDFATSSRIVFKNNPLESAFNAIKNKCKIITDVEMVMSAINKVTLKQLDLSVNCYISNEQVIKDAKKNNMTRSELAMRYAANEINGGIVGIGNAPTALYELIKMINEGVTKPSLIIGIPVGFVAAPESKEELSRLKSIPLITNIGRKGGSSVVSSIINAILLLYKSRINAF